MNLFTYFVCAFYTLSMILCVVCNEVNLIWYRILQFYVSENVINFLSQHQINNCFYKFQNEDTLLLKCMRNNKLVNVNINIENSYKQKRFYESLSI